MRNQENEVGLMGGIIRADLGITKVDRSAISSSDPLSPLFKVGNEKIVEGSKLSFLVPERKEVVKDRLTELDRFFVRAILLWLAQEFPRYIDTGTQLIGDIEVSPFGYGRKLVTFSSTDAVPDGYVGKAGNIEVSMMTYRLTMPRDYAPNGGIDRSSMETPFLVGQKGGETVLIGSLNELQAEHGENLDQFLNQFLVVGEVGIFDLCRWAGVYEAK